MSTLLMLFAKAPIPGQVKTRLTPFLSKQDAAVLQEAFIEDLLQNTKKIATQQVIACSPDTAHPFFKSCQKKHDLTLIAQQGGDLGERMLQGFRWGFEAGFQKVVIIGCDSPTLPPSFIQDAFAALDHQELILGPSLDGGYYLIGASQLFPGLFEGISWGTKTVLIQSLEIINADTISCHLLPFWYDIDLPEDLQFLKTHLQFRAQQGNLQSPATQNCLSQLLDKKQSPA